MSDRDIAVSVRGLSKSYTIAHNAPKHTTLAKALRHIFKKSAQHCSLDLERGSVNAG